MRNFLKILIPFTLLTMAGCVVAPYGYHRGYYGRPHAAVFVPAPVVVVRPY